MFTERDSKQDELVNCVANWVRGTKIYAKSLWF